MVTRTKAAAQPRQQNRLRTFIVTGGVLSLLIAALWALPALAEDRQMGEKPQAEPGESAIRMGCTDVPVPWVPGALELDDPHTEMRQRAPIESPAGDKGCTTV